MVRKNRTRFNGRNSMCSHTDKNITCVDQFLVAQPNILWMIGPFFLVISRSLVDTFTSLNALQNWPLSTTFISSSSRRVFSPQHIPHFSCPLQLLRPKGISALKVIKCTATRSFQTTIRIYEGIINVSLMKCEVVFDFVTTFKALQKELWSFCEAEQNDCWFCCRPFLLILRILILRYG